MKAVLTAGLCVLMTGVFLSPAATELLQFDRSAVDSGQWWRLLTSHLTHWNSENFFWNVAAFAVLGGLCETASRLRFVATVVVSAVAIAAAAWFLAPEFTVYRGISGIDTGLFGLLTVNLLRVQWRERNGLGLAIVATLAVGLVTKTGFELATGRAVFVDSAAAGFVPMPLAHAVGAVVGVIIALLPRPSGHPMLVFAVLLPGCAAARPPAEAGFTLHQVDIGAAERQTVLAGALLGGDVAELAVLNIEEDDNCRLRIYAFDDSAWTPRLDTTLRPEVLFVDVADIDGRDRLVTYGGGRLSWFDPESSTEHELVKVISDFNPPPRSEIPHVDVTRDVNDDGRDDLVVPAPDGFVVFVQMDGGVFAEPVRIGTPPRMGRIYGADGYRYDPWASGRVYEIDYNRDGRTDLVFWDEDHFEVREQDERGLFTHVPRTFTTEVKFDSDEIASLAAPGGVHRRRRDHAVEGEMRGRVLYSLSDLNGDGVADLVVFSLEGGKRGKVFGDMAALWNMHSAFEVHFGTPSPDGGTEFGTEVDTTIISDGIPFGTGQHDFDDDGQVDMMFTTIDPGMFMFVDAILFGAVTFELQFSRMEDGGYADEPDTVRTFRAETPPVESGGKGAFFPSVMLTDVNKDGRADLLVQKGRKELHVFLGVAGPDVFARRPQKVAVTMPQDEEYTWLVDLDRDGTQDIFMHHPSTNGPHHVTMLIPR